MIPRRLLLAGAAAALAPVAARAEEISVTQYGASLYGLPFTVAQEIGAFDRAGIHLTGFMGSGGGGTTVRNLFASETPYGDVAVGAALAAAAGGLPVKIVNVGTRSVAEASLVTMPGSDIKTLKDMIGKKVALTSPKGVSEMLFLLAMRTQGLDPAQVTRVYSGGYGPSLTLLEQGAVAAAALIEPLSIQRADRYRTVVAYRDILPPMTTSVGITSPAYAAAQPAKLRAIIAGRREGVQAIYKDPAAAAAICARAYDLPPAIAAIAVQNMIAPRMWSEGNFVQAELDRMVDALKLIQQVSGPPDWSTLIDRSFLPADLRA
jgi:NitT/TauT family transport system substrate-binding protein